MNAGIRPPTTHYVNSCIEFQAQAFFKLSLHTMGIVLPLPAMIFTAVIGQMDKIALHFFCGKFRKNIGFYRNSDALLCQ